MSLLVLSLTNLDATLVLEGHGQPMERANRLLVLGQVLIEILRPLEGKVGIKCVKTVGLPIISMKREGMRMLASYRLVSQSRPLQERCRHSHSSQLPCGEVSH